MSDERSMEYMRTVQETSWLVLDLAQRLERGFASRAAEFGLSGAQAKVLLALQSEEALPMRVLARELGFDPSNLTGLVDRLEEKGLIERRPDAADRRIKAIAVTREGSRLREDFQRRLTSDAGALAKLNDPQIRDLQDLLKVALA